MSMVALSTVLATRTVATMIYPHVIINSITSIASNLILGIGHLLTISDDTELQSIILTTDIIQDIQIIKSFVEDKEKHKTNNKSLLSCIDNLNKTLIDLESNINIITQKTEYNKQVWFSYFRRYNTTKEKENIILLIKQLNHRFELFVKICSIIYI